ncbi:MAG TPA: DUF1326 domain-containing protein [Verrucomicrobiae bacterium]|jgi:hypothetical protein|nr:DUF1326 domain-containing protein [Verrucomicrobiae bacterium]
MAGPQWKISGDYFEACSCDSVCPCPTSGLAGRPTKGSCDAGLVFHIERGAHGTTSLDGLNFAVLLHTPEAMGAGNWTVGLIVDERATAAQREAIVAIGSGQGGGPMAAVGPLVTKFAGVESRPIRIERGDMRRSVSIPGMLDISVDGIPGASPGEPIYLDNVGHPAASRLALAKASRGHLHAFGIDWDDTSGKVNGHFAPFAWSSS